MPDDVPHGFVQHKQPDEHERAPGNQRHRLEVRGRGDKEHQRRQDRQKRHLPPLQLHHREGHDMERNQHQHHDAADVIDDAKQAQGLQDLTFLHDSCS